MNHLLLLSVTVIASVFADWRVGAQDSQPASRPTGFERMEEATRKGDFGTVMAECERLRVLVPRGSPGWFYASANLVQVHLSAWNTDHLEAVARDVLAAVVEQQERSPSVVRSIFGPIDPDTAGLVIEVEVALARLHQSRGDHAEAVRLLRPAFDALSTMKIERSSRHIQELGLVYGRSLLALAEKRESTEAFERVRTRFPKSRQAAIATVLIERISGTSAGYRGKYEGDPEHVARMQVVETLVPKARLRLAKRLGLEVEKLPEVIVGVADLSPEIGANAAVTVGEPRTPLLAPVTVVFSEALALRLRDVESLLVHELGHGVMIVLAGRVYESMPPWVTEGISHHLAGEFDELFETVLATRFFGDMAAFVSTDPSVSLRFVFQLPGGGTVPTPEAGLALAYLDVHPGPGGIDRFIQRILNGDDFEEAMMRTAGLGVDAFLRQAEHWVTGVLVEKRRIALGPIVALRDAQQHGSEAVRAAAEIIMRRSTSPLPKGLARILRAQALTALGRPDEAFSVYESLLADLPSTAPFVEMAHTGAVRALLADGRTADAKSRLQRLRRDAITDETRAWADAESSRLAK